MFEGPRAKGQGIKVSTRTLCALLFIILYPLSLILSQEAPATTPKPGARLQFVPPPMEGTISMGIYDGNGKLVRALHRAEEIDGAAFGKALNGLITSWDGKNDTCAQMPAGKYFARGYMVGDLAIEGEAMHGNDWITDDHSPRIRAITRILADSDKLIFFAQTVDEKVIVVKSDPNGKIETAQSPAEVITDKLQAAQDRPTIAVGADLENAVTAKLAPSNQHPKVTIAGEKVVIDDGNAVRTVETAPGETILDTCASRTGGAWLIVRNGTASEVREYSPEGEFKRRLVIQPEGPQPVKIAAPSSGDTIFLLEQSPAGRRLRALSLVSTGTAATGGADQATQPASQRPATTSAGTAAVSGTEQAISTWKVLFDKTITFSDTLEQARSLLKFPDGKPFEAQDKIKVSLLPNPLVQDQPGSMEISAGFDAEGSFLKGPDGLLLKRISDTPNLKWAAIAREPGSKILVLFQSDGAVVEEYRIAHPANMMAFDCGDFDFDPAKMK